MSEDIDKPRVYPSTQEFLALLEGDKPSRVARPSAPRRAPASCTITRRMPEHLSMDELRERARVMGLIAQCESHGHAETFLALNGYDVPSWLV